MTMTAFNSMEDFFAAQEKEAAASAQNILNECRVANVDFSVIDEPVLKTKRLNYGGVQFKAHIHTNEDALRGVSQYHQEHFVSLVQVFTKAGSIISVFTKEQIANSGHNWANETQISHDDILNRTVAAVGLTAHEQGILQIAKHIAFETDSNGKQYYDGIDGRALHRVWD